VIHEQLYPQRWRFALALEEEDTSPTLLSSASPTLVRTRSHWHFDLPDIGCAMDLYRWDSHDFQIEVDVTVERTETESFPPVLSRIWWTAFKMCLSRYVHPNHFLLCLEAPLQQIIEPWILNSLRRDVHLSFPHFTGNIRPMTDSAFRSKINRDFRVSVKLDGQNEVFVVAFMNGVIVLIVNHVIPIEIRYVYAPLNESSRSNQSVMYVLQGEWMRQTATVHCFDALVLNGRSLLSETHISRVDRMNDINTWTRIQMDLHQKTNGSLKLVSKPWASTIHQLDKSDPSDGWIWMDSRKSYLQTVIFKDKPVRDLTVDVLVRSGSCYSSTNDVGVLDKWSEDFLVQCGACLRLPRTYWMDLTQQESIIECQIEYNNHPSTDPAETDCSTRLYPLRLIPVRYRPGKAKPNSWYVIQQTRQAWLESARPLGVLLSMRTTVEQCRSAHNLVKQHLITEYVSGSTAVLDIGFGKGGDLFKYAHSSGLQTIYACEPNMEHWTEAWSRYASKFSFQLVGIQIGTPCQELSLKELPVVDTVCMFFSFAYLWKNEQSVFHWLNVLDVVQPKTLILTFLDQYELGQLIMNQRSTLVSILRADGGYQQIECDWSKIRQRLDSGEGFANGSAFGNDVKICTSPSQTAQHVEEWLVHQPTLTRLLHERGWRIVLNKLFSEHLKDTWSDPWHKLFRAQVWTRVA
jgi:hypothetical protein